LISHVTSASSLRSSFAGLKKEKRDFIAHKNVSDGAARGRGHDTSCPYAARPNTPWERGEEKSRSLHCAAGARVRERRKKPAAPVGMTVAEGMGRYVGLPIGVGTGAAPRKSL